ncbi:unnamed protein product [Thlaspi arvense]|uniref:Phytocyanin domain-containing protein n=1 Tax=Thlaspi arvense TaxID=13288 RepID=A0AAU9SYU8_THLAR|nr:unnamed protein product [Thlaspi arvense]
MGISAARKLLLVLVITACVFSGSAEAWSWSWGSGQSGSNWGWGWGSDNSGGSSGSGSGGSASNSGGSSWGWGWSSNGTDTNWGWGSSSGAHHSSGTGSTSNSHHNHTSPSNHSSGTSHHNHTAPVSSRRKIEVTVWKNGFDYQEWSSKQAPLYVGDVLVVEYKNNDQTQSKAKHSNKNDVYLLPDLRSFKRCDVGRGKKLAARGGSSSSLGFKLLLRKSQTYYFTSGDHNGCNHNMKFSLSPVPRSSPHTKP